VTADAVPRVQADERAGAFARDPARDSRTLRLTDGRTLGFAEYGDVRAPALFFFHGFPGSRLDAPALWRDEPHNVRVIAPDRPGTGLSTLQPRRRLIDWADDVRQLADSLGIARFRVAGFSGGGPFALAAAYGLGDRVIAAACIAGAGPLDTADALAGMNRGNRLLFGMAKHTPVLLRLLALPNARAHVRSPATTYAKALASKGLPAADRDVMSASRFRDISVAAMPEPFRQGVRGFVQEIRMYVHPWGFDPSAIQQPTFFWHGDHDVNVPLPMVRGLAARIAGSALTVCPGEAHLLLPTHWDEAVAQLLAAT
jgi:pimeloyl-ACP methyl ester carboxylesterase